jgi:hypothetical protein
MKIKNSKKIFWAVICLSLIVTLSTMINNVKAIDITNQQKALEICNNVLGFNSNDYSVMVNDYLPTPQTQYLGVVPQENLLYHLSSGKSNISILYTYAKDNLQVIQILSNNNGDKTSKSAVASNLATAENFLNKYQEYTNDLLYGNLRSTLNNVDFKSNTTKVFANFVLETINLEDGTTNFKWYYTANSATAPYSKFIAIGTKNGELTAFVNNWNVYAIGSTEVKISIEQAINIALAKAKEYDWSVPIDASSLASNNLNSNNIRFANLTFDDSIGVNSQRNQDVLALYPVWHIGVALDKWYGYLYGIEIDIWADNGQIRSTEEAWSTLPPPENTSIGNVAVKESSVSILSFSSQLSLSIVGAAFASTTILILVQKKVIVKTSHRQFRQKSLGIIVGLLLVTSVMLSLANPVGATTRGSVVWGSQSDGGINLDGSHWRKHYTEIGNQTAIANTLTSYFQNYAGYTAYNHQGNRTPGSTVGQIEGDIGNLQYYNDYVAVVDFDHGISGYPQWAPPGEEHYMFEDNTGTVIGTQSQHTTNWNHGVYDMDIYQWTQANKVIFAFINTCQSADINRLGQGLLDTQWNPNPRALGMPFAWTHRLVADKSSQGFNVNQYISSDGYNSPDWGFQVYIGFPYGSASLEQGIPFNGGGGNPYYYWVTSFFYHALYYDISVNDALDSASWQFMGSSFGASPLRTGFPAWWWNFGSQDGCTMAVYGNGNIHLKNFASPYDGPSTPMFNGPTTGSSDVSYDFSAFSTNPYGRDIEYTFDWGDGTQTVTDCSDGQTAYESHVWSSGGTYAVKVQAESSNGIWSAWSSPIYMNIDQQNVWIDIIAEDEANIQLSANIWVDSNWVGTGSAGLEVSYGWHYIEADTYVWDDYYGTYVFPVSGTGWYYFTGYTYLPIIYSY